MKSGTNSGLTTLKPYAFFALFYAPFMQSVFGTFSWFSWINSRLNLIAGPVLFRQGA